MRLHYVLLLGLLLLLVVLFALPIADPVYAISDQAAPTLSPFVPTATPTPVDIGTSTVTPTPTPISISPFPIEKKIYLPIVNK